LEGWDVLVVQLNSSLDAREELTEGWQPTRLDVREVLMDIGKNWGAYTGLVLEPGGGDAEEAAGGCVSSPKLQELKYLAFSLNEVKWSESSARE
jgi:hypothetical protein